MPGEEPLVAFPLVLPMGWSKSPPIFSTATETIAYLANERLMALPGSRNIFSTMQHALTNKANGRIALKKVVHNALDDFRWMQKNIDATCPTCIAEIIPLLPAAEGHHDVSGMGAGGVWFLGDNITPHEGYVGDIPILW